MSGGNLNYIYLKLLEAREEMEADELCASPIHKKFIKHLKKVEEALHDIEWVLSGDSAVGSDIPAIKRVLSKKTELYVIWSKQHREWWRDDSQGYTKNLASAGVYSDEDLENICMEDNTLLRLKNAFHQLQGQAMMSDKVLMRIQENLMATNVKERM